MFVFSFVKILCEPACISIKILYSDNSKSTKIGDFGKISISTSTLINSKRNPLLKLMDILTRNDVCI